MKGKKSKQPILILYNADGAELFHGRPIDLQFSEALIILKSIQFFRDPSPCYIHRGAVIIRLQEEVIQAVETLGQLSAVKMVPFTAIENEIQAYLHGYPGVDTLRLE